MGEIISIISHKGGVGKTTTTVNLGASLTLAGYRVLLVDLDPQGQVATSFHFGQYDLKCGIFELLVEQAAPEDAVHATSLEGLELIPFSAGLQAESPLREALGKDAHIFNTPFSKLKSAYDFILIDCPPSIGELTYASLTVSNSIIVPIQCEYYALNSLGRLLKFVRDVKKNMNPNLKYRGFLVTMVDLRSNLSRLVMNRLRYTLGRLVLDTAIPRNIRLAEVPLYGKPAVLIDKNSKGAKSYIELAQELLNQHGTSESSLSKNYLKLVENY
ncbi:MAG: ParA family protein [bacterium]|nr:ParA family protein [bacterium]